ncbi:MAG: DUF1523 family protein [Nitrospiraceae bacterium]|nr:MAG: DUF1523 family protein [Nitrospiraceae bacterium]
MNETLKKIKRSFLITAGIVLVIAAAGFYSYFIADTVETVINDTEVKRYNGNDTYLVFTDYGVLQNTDARYRFKFNSSDIQNTCIRLKGKKAEIKKYGWRIRPLSWYENIVAVEEIAPNQ